MRCPACGHENADAVKFCPECGAPVSPAPPARETRKIVTIVFSDLAGSTSLGEQLDPEALRGLMTRYFDAMQARVEAHGGIVEKFIGDAVMAVFGVPKTHEDDALRAVRAAAAMRDAQAELNEDFERAHGIKLRVRTGVNTGEVVTGESPDRQRIVTGDAVNVAARLEQAAQPGEILLGPETYRLVRAAVEAEELDEPLELKGKTEPMPAYRLIEVRGHAPGIAPRSSGTSFVGRERERGEIEDAYARVAGDRTAGLFTLLGTAGVGKSRLVGETLAGLDLSPVVLAGRCLSYGDGITFWPVLEIVKAAAGISDEDPPAAVTDKVAAIFAGDETGPGEGGDAGGETDEQGRIAADRLLSLMGLARATGSIEDIQWAFARFIEAIGAAGPVVMVIDDLHWAEPALLDLLERVAGWRLPVPVLLLCVARPDLLEERPSWAAEIPGAASVALDPLDERAGRALVEALLGATDLDDETTERIVRAAGGNPLFVEELLATLTEDGYLVLDGAGVWRTERPIEDFEIPASVGTLLAARLERLASEELGVLEGGAVIGQVFERGAVAELCPDQVRPGVAAYLGALVRKDLLRPEDGGTSTDESFRFRHILLRDAAYAAMAKASRAELHERFADWLEQAAGGRLAEYREILGHHLERAHAYRKELGAPQATCEALARRASAHLTAAAWKALGTGDRRAATELLERAASLLPPGDPDRIVALAEHASACWDLGEINQKNRSSKAAAEEARAGGDAALIAYTTYLQEALDDEPFDASGLRAKAEHAIEALDGRDDLRGELARSWMTLGVVEYPQGRYAAAARAWDRAAEAGRSVERLASAISECRAWQTGALVYDATPAEDALATLRDTFLTEAKGSQLAMAAMRAREGTLLAMCGEFEEGRRLMLEWRDVSRAYGIRGETARANEALSRIYRWEGRLDEARQASLQAQEEWIGTDEDQPPRDWYLDGGLAEIELRRGDLAEAERYALLLKDAGQDDHLSVGWQWRCVLAVVEADRGARDEAVQLIEEAHRLIEDTEEFLTVADSFMYRAEVMERLGEHRAAREAAQRALDMYTHKGIVPEIKRCQEYLERLPD